MFEQFINSLKLFGEIPDDDVDIIVRELSYREVKEGEALILEGKICKEIYFICTGVLRIVSRNDQGIPHILVFLKENQFCSLLNSFNNDVISKDGIEAACDSELIVLKRQKLINLYEKLPYLKTLITAIQVQALLDKAHLKNLYKGEDAGTRYNNFLLRQPEIALRVSLTDVASYLGITRQSLSRIRKNTH